MNLYFNKTILFAVFALSARGNAVSAKLVEGGTTSDTTTNCKVVHRRPIFGFGGDASVTVDRNGDWKELAAVFQPFGYEAPDPLDGAVRQWRMYAVHWDENSAGQTNVQIKFDLPGDDEDPVFTFPRVAGGFGGWRAEGYSNYFQFGTGSAEETNKGHAKAYVRLQSSAPFNNNGRVDWAEMVAYDCPL